MVLPIGELPTELQNQSFAIGSGVDRFGSVCHINDVERTKVWDMEAIHQFACTAAVNIERGPLRPTSFDDPLLFLTQPVDQLGSIGVVMIGGNHDDMRTSVLVPDDPHPWQYDRFSCRHEAIVLSNISLAPLFGIYFVSMQGRKASASSSQQIRSICVDKVCFFFPCFVSKSSTRY